MKRNIFAILVVLALGMLNASVYGLGYIDTKDVSIVKGEKSLFLKTDLVLDSLKLKSSEQVFVTPVLYGASDNRIVFPTVLVTGRGMHYAYERGTMHNLKKYTEKYDIMKEVRRNNDKPQSIEYSASVPLEPWMRMGRISVQFYYDNCGCGVFAGQEITGVVDTTLNPVSSMQVAYVTPRVTELPMAFHEGSARVQFEVNRTELHDSIYRCRSGQIIDNREQLKVIYDSIEYALTDPNIDITEIEIVGYASPESPYEHNKTLAMGRSKALADFIGKYVNKKYSISPEVTKFDAVPENWVEFRGQVVNSSEITDQQREDLLELIDRPAFSPDDFDAKEKELKTNPKFKSLYLSKILPEWFPRLRATKFRIGTRLKPMNDERLAEVIKTSPEKMSLNQMMRVARLYPEGSDEFIKTIETALKYYPDDETANLNAAINAINRGDYGEAEIYLRKAGDSPEAINARAVVMTSKEDYDKARTLLQSVPQLPEAQKNYLLLQEDY